MGKDVNLKLEEVVLWRGDISPKHFLFFCFREKYGEEFVDVEVGKKEDRDGDNAPMQFSLFLDIYGERDLYMVHTMPVSMHGLLLYVVISLFCGLYSLTEVIILNFRLEL